MRLLVKIGGAQIEQAPARHTIAGAIANARAAGHQVIVVHGGGNQIRSVGRALGLEDRYHDGLRITDARTAEVVLMVLGGLVNRTLVAALAGRGVAAVGLTGADGAFFTARQLTRPGVDLGYVGEIDQVAPQLVETLLATGLVPVIATVAKRTGSAADEPFLNLNADHAAGPLCRALDCDALLFLTDVPGVLDARKQHLAELTPAACERLVTTGVATGGMLPKLEAALRALRDHPLACIKIAQGSGADAVLDALRPDRGTRFVSDQPTRSSLSAEPHHG